VLIQPLNFFISTMIFSKISRNQNLNGKSYRGFAGIHFSCCENCIRMYRYVGVATAAGAEALPKPLGASE